MIPLSAIPWRLIGYGAAVAAVGLLAWRISVWHDSHKALPGVQAALEAEQACGEGSKCAERVAALQARQAAISETVVSGYETELASLRNRPVTVRTVRVCSATNSGPVHRPGPAAPTHGTGPAAGLGDAGTQPDIGPDLYALAATCDQLTARLRGLQQWNKALATPHPQ